MLVIMLMLPPSVNIAPSLIHVISGVGAALPSQVRTTLLESWTDNVPSGVSSLSIGDLINVGAAKVRR